MENEGKKNLSELKSDVIAEAAKNLPDLGKLFNMAFNNGCDFHEFKADNGEPYSVQNIFQSNDRELKIAKLSLPSHAILHLETNETTEVIVIQSGRIEITLSGSENGSISLSRGGAFRIKKKSEFGIKAFKPSEVVMISILK